MIKGCERREETEGEERGEGEQGKIDKGQNKGQTQKGVGGQLFEILITTFKEKAAAFVAMKIFLETFVAQYLLFFCA